MSGGAVPPGGTLGVLGGGQLGRMLAVAAARLGIRTAIYSPEADPPAGHVAARHVRGGWDDAEALRRFAEGCDVVTLEWENVPLDALGACAAAVVRPSARAVAAAQDRLEEKRFLAGLGLSVAPFAAVDDAASLEAALARIGAPAILKTRRLGYDGKGQARIGADGDGAAALEAMAGAPAILEGLVRFRREVSVVAARGADGRVVCFDPAENLHEGGILRRSSVPAALSPTRETEARAAAEAVLSALDFVGVMGVELFETEAGFVVNEIAPRVHNTGHWTLDACLIDQFEQHVRAVCGWPLGDGARHSDAVMTNLIGDEAAEWAELAADPSLALHLYGKAEARPGRKMGHVTRLTPRR
ncbi:MAG: 5-(carboxyamino)imidazole ribonucleotide synthase [Paracoccaceae bacterium]